MLPVARYSERNAALNASPEPTVSTTTTFSPGTNTHKWWTNWQLDAEAFVYEGNDVCPGWGTGVMDTWGPDRAVWVNGDPVGLISREMMLEFEQPYTCRLFTSAGGGLFHNHTLGL